MWCSVHINANIIQYNGTRSGGWVYEEKNPKFNPNENHDFFLFEPI